MDNPICFSIAAGHNDGNGQTIWRYVHNHEVLEWTGRNWADLNKEERDDVVHLFGAH